MSFGGPTRGGRLNSATDSVTAIIGGPLPGPIQVDIEQFLGVAASPVNPIDIAVCVAGGVIDPRNIRALTFAGDKIDVTGSTVNATVVFPATYDISDRAARLLGIVYGNVDKLQQDAVTKDLLTEIRYGGAVIDPRNIRALTSADVASAEITKWIGSAAPTIGQKHMASSLPVVIADDQSAVAVTLAAAPLTQVDIEKILGAAVSLANYLPVGVSFGGAQIDPRAIRALTSADIVTPYTPATIGEFADITPGGAATRFTAVSTPCKGVVVRSIAANAAVGRVGDASVDATHGAEISPGDSIAIAIDNVNKVYVYLTGTDKASMSYVA